MTYETYREHLNELQLEIHDLRGQMKNMKPVVRGKWTNEVEKEYKSQMFFWHCTNCGEDVEVPTCLGDPLYNFCPNCGASMVRGDSK